ncbi:MAG: hypothetical protein A3E80_03080 [Chlamydiae bacterium RIFCSPHIGHO2_12_FULL_49_9]|nr:MAG: hypothetical protein A3E80_03080 [Chlamydiae bacterium RIFCSPHIGHO2_12_FULL_49_9]HLB52462.1 hypothetical protein [Chlamydiales bacterium]
MRFFQVAVFGLVLFCFWGLKLLFLDTKPAFLVDSYNTHQPILREIVNKTKGPIIEFGCGHGSTDLLHEICKKEGRLLVTLEDNLDWFTQFSNKYEGDGYNKDNSGWHKFFFVPGKNQKDNESPAHWTKFLDELELLKTVTFDVCFIDQSPWLARWETLKRMKTSTRYVIVHDCDYFPTNKIFGKTVVPIENKKPGVFDFSDVFRSFKVYFPRQPWPGDTGPPTLLGSDFESDLPEVNFGRN